MNKKELEKTLTDINQRLSTLGELSQLVQQGQSLQGLISDSQAKKTTLEPFLVNIPLQSKEVQKLIIDVKNLNEQLSTRGEEVGELEGKIEELQKKSEKLVEETRAQLGVAANAKLASTFEQVKTDLTSDKDKWFKWLFGATAILVLATGLIVWWQVEEAGSIIELSFLIKIVLTSPFVYFVIFTNREYGRTRNLIEEYTFKAAIARSFEAYKEIVQSVDSADSEKTLSFILSTISGLYSSPMVNVKNNSHAEGENTPDILSRVSSLVKPDIVDKLSK